jgi:hypothetical protein
MRLGLGLGVKNSGFVGGYDSATSAFLAATGITSKTESDAVNNLVKNLKSYGLWSKMKAIYPFVSDTYNLFNYSQDFANAGWSKSNVTVTANTTTAPDGTTTASTAQNTQASSYIFQSNLALSATTYTQSVYAKKNNNDWFAIYTSDQGANYSIAWFNLNTGIKGTASAVGNFSATSSTMTSVGNGWYRCSLTFTKPTTTATDSASIVPSGDNTFTRVIGQNVYMWGAQFQTGALTDYQLISTTTSNRFVSQFKYNLKDARDLDAAFRLAFNGGWTYSKQGAKANGTSAYANTYYNTSVNSITNSNTIGFYANIANTSALADPSSMGNVRISDLNGSTMTASGTSMSTRLNNAPIAGTISGATGLFTATRQSATVTKLFKNATQTATGNSGGVPINETVFIANSNIGGSPYAAGYVSNQFTFAHMSDGLSDSEVSNLYTSVQLFQQELSRYVGVPIVSDANAQAFLDAAVITDQTQANAVNTLVTDLKTYGLWTKMKAIYPFVGGTATTHKWNLKDPRDLDAAYRLAFSGAWTHSSTGALPNGTNAFADSFFIPSTALSLNSSHLGFYSRTNNTTGIDDLSAVIVGDTQNMRIIINLTGSLYVDLNSANERVTGANANSTGFYQASRTSSTSLKVYKNNTTFGTNTSANTGTLPIISMYIGAAHRGTGAINYSNRECAFATLGDGLSDTEATNLYTSVQKFETSLNRQI